MKYEPRKAIGLLGGAAALIVGVGWGSSAVNFATGVQTAPDAPVSSSPAPPPPPSPQPVPDYQNPQYGGSSGGEGGGGAGGG
ncbi:MAG: hypothetical protein JO082_16495 [Mycobacterium sp.]|nr:hypothetical protein [Mycobacterium sp.]MBV9723503.1 hypothetical protein [Mycobacterium sp.]